jgi:hypothetical protein
MAAEDPSLLIRFLISVGSLVPNAPSGSASPGKEGSGMWMKEV